METKFRLATWLFGAGNVANDGGCLHQSKNDAPINDELTHAQTTTWFL